MLLAGKDAGGKGFHLSLADMREEQNLDFRGIELLTLSGCETALGPKDSDDREIDRFGLAAQIKGAKAALATLCAVEDGGSAPLMKTFYRLWLTTPGLTKVEALQRAQLLLLRGAAAGQAVQVAAKSSQAPQYSNPFYWAPFVLIGNCAGGHKV
jgi:CHAT domain-containing protein